MANYPRTEEQMMKRTLKAMARNMARNARRMNCMHRCDDRVFTWNQNVKRNLCDVSRAETPESVQNRESDLNSEEERKNFKKEMDYANRLNRVEDSTGLTISGNEDAKREFLDSTFVKTLETACDAFDLPRGVVSEINIVDSDDKKNQLNRGGAKTLADYRDNVGVITVYLPKIEIDKIALNNGVIYHEFAHAKIHSWGKFSKNGFDLEVGECFIEVKLKYYEETAADFLTEETIKNPLDIQAVTGKAVILDVDNLMGAFQESLNTSVNNLDEICHYRAHAKVYGVNAKLKEIDRQLGTILNINMHDQSNSIVQKIDTLTNLYSDLRGTTKEKYKSMANEAMNVTHDLTVNNKLFNN